jgi:Fe-S oxidoreductase
MARLPDDEKRTIQSWMHLSTKNEIFYPGCNFFLMPYLSFSKLFSGFTIMGSPDLCCGEQFYRTGLLDVFEDIGKYLQQRFREIGVKKMITTCIACSNVLSNVHPKFDVKFDFEVETLYDWLSRRIHDGKLVLKRPGDNKTVTLHDNCQAKAFGNHYYDLAREILGLIGYKVTEMKHSRSISLCCGMAAFAARHSIDDILAASSRRLKEAEETHSEMLVTYCSGCLWTLSMANILNPRSGILPYHLTELVQIALGEKPAHKHDQRAKQIFDEAMKGAATLATSKERVWLGRETP